MPLTPAPPGADPPTIGILYAAPLIYEKTDDAGETQRYPIDVLDFASERENLLTVFGEANRVVQVHMLDGTPANLQKLVTLNSRVLHYSGHGMPEFLALEGPHGLTHELSVERLREMLQASVDAEQLQLAFVSACYSQAAGQAFVEAGVRHVVAITLDAGVYDLAAMRFAAQFYLALLSGRTVRQAFDSALQRVRNDPELSRAELAEGEVSKFLLLPDTAGYDHDRPLFADVPTGAHQPPSPWPPCSVPPNLRRVFGRANEQQHALALLANNRLLTLAGIGGIGKTTLAREIGGYLQARRACADGVFFYELRGAQSTDGLRNQLAGDVAGLVSVPDDATLLRLLRDKRLLLIIDNCEDPLNNFGKDFRAFLGALLAASPHIKLLLTSRQPVGALRDTPEQTLPVRRLDGMAALDLFLDRAPEPRRSELAEAYSTLNRRERLARSPLFTFLSGHPNALCIVAGALSELTLDEVMHEVATRKLDAMVDRNIPPEERDAYTSMTVSLDLSITQLQVRLPAALPLFGLLELLPGGARATDLDELWVDEGGTNPWKPLMDELVRRNLVDKAGHGDAAHYTTFPFVTGYAESLLSAEQHAKSAGRVKGMMRDAINPKGGPAHISNC